MTMLDVDNPASADQEPRISFNPLVHWLISEGWVIRELPALVAALGQTLNAAGIGVYRMRISLRILHPLFIGVTQTWYRATNQVEEYRPPHAVLLEDRYLLSPLAAIYEGAGAIRRRLDIPAPELDYPILRELLEEGATDYVAMPLLFSDGRLSALTIASDRPGGFETWQLAMIDQTLPAIAHAFEVHALRLTAESILDTFLGHTSGERVLNGSIRRGDGEDIFAVLWYSDLRGSTRLADRMPRQAFLALLNDYFDCTAGAVLAHGGEVLSFIGDAVFAIFPIGQAVPSAEGVPCNRSASAAAIVAARESLERLATLNQRLAEQGEAELAFGIGLHLGNVTYGNIGVPERLDFTVIGPAANEVARLAALCKRLERTILISAALASQLPETFVSLGFHGLAGVRQPVEVFTVP